ncbi:glycoside hydrolase family 30 protein [Niveomyces insectorum RCEF 264]|uniref:Glycoside hydrolase family 30 protein n=1 Tax=Niveomyces insectorum RCEF 264 TaxID=1081102 RepID=A0A167NSK9_9HYPO|nr:glycoside hydrolase family 30 protein [Niveomyces insectorum RCEF 264]
MRAASPLLLPLAGLMARPTRAAEAPVLEIAVDLNTTYQTIDGFGFSEAFQRAKGIVNLPEPQRTALVDLLFNATSGAGFTIVRNGIGSSPNSTNDWMNTIEPQAPARPNDEPTYVWDGKDSGQLWVSQQAVKYGVKTFYADAWSAPGFMKNNSNDADGGALCGSPGVDCTTGDWRQAYANYLVKNVQLYRDNGVNITHLGFLNEPDFQTAYASMQMDGKQAADFIKVLQPTLLANNLSDVHVACCDATGWATQRTMINDIVAAGAEPLLGVVTSHIYTSKIDGPLPTTRKVWESETADLGGRWSTAWFSANASAANDTKATAGDGLTWARNIHTALTTGNVSAYLWWVATQDAATNNNNNEKLVLVGNGTYTVARRLWAFAQYSRVVRPGAVRVAVTSRSSVLRTTAFRNADGAVAVVVINDGGTDAAVVVDAGLREASAASPLTAQAWITDATHNMGSTAVAVAANGTVTGAVVAAHGVLSVVVRPPK